MLLYSFECLHIGCTIQLKNVIPYWHLIICLNVDWEHARGAVQQFCSIPYTLVPAGGADAGGLTAPLSAPLSTSAPPAAGMRAAPFRTYGLLSSHLSYRSTQSLLPPHLAVLVSPPHRSRHLCHRSRTAVTHVLLRPLPSPCAVAGSTR